MADTLWLAFGKEFRVLGLAGDEAVEIIASPLPLLDLGDITAATIVSGETPRVYFGHSDGRVSIYSTTDYRCQKIVHVSLNRITTLAESAGFLWAGYSSGALFVYDVTKTPWVVKKEWRAHTNPVVSLVADRSSIWKLNRLQVLSLGVENVIGVWDGMLEEDWMGKRLYNCGFSQRLILIRKRLGCT